MEEKAKSKVLIYIIVVLVVLILVLVIGGIVGYKNLSDKIDNSQASSQEDNNIVSESINNSEQQNIIESTIKNISLNNTDAKIKMEIEKGEAVSYEDDLYELKYNIDINGTKVSNIKDSSGGILWQNYNIEKIKDANNNKEYIVLKIYKNFIAGSRGIYLYIIDENANILGELEKEGGTSYTVGIVKDDEGNIVDYEDIFVDDISVLEDQIIYYVDINSGVEKHKYTINNGKFTDLLVKTYDNNEVERAGKSS